MLTDTTLRSAVDSLSAAVHSLTENHHTALDQLAESDEPEDIREEMWKDLYKVFKSISELGDSWNNLAGMLTKSKT